MARLGLHGLGKRFGKVWAIRDVDLEIADGELLVFVGPSGCGKSTLLRLIAGLEDPSDGEIRIDGEPVNDRTPAERGVAMVFQSYALYPHMSVFDNMAFGLKLAKLGRAGIAERVRRAAAGLHIEALLDRKPRALSGGQRQRVALGRALVREPKLFLFDEPLSNLDAALRVEMRLEIKRLHAELGTTMIYVTHDQVEAMTLADRIAVLDAGRVAQVGSPLEVYRRPRNLFVAGFLGSPRINCLTCRVAAAGGASAALALPGGARLTLPVTAGRLAAGDAVTLGIRPEDLAEADAGHATLRGQVLAVERLGSESYLHLRVGDGAELTMRAAADTAARAGDELTVGIPADRCRLFDAGGTALPDR